MRKSKKAITAAALSFAREITAKYPDASYEIVLDAPGGFDAWVRFGIPPELEDSYNDMLHDTAHVSFEVYDETGVNVIATITDKELVGS
jgi:hypothetical protein